MRLLELIENKFKPRLINIYIIGSNGRQIPPELKKFVDTHVKLLKNPEGEFDRYVNEYNDEWYQNTNLGHNIRNFDDLLTLIKQYYAIGRVIRK